ncbi:MAG: ATP-binding cassette domain-containing protein [Lachnospiraceae bacterium]|nr:ATP-binding cassette domain-containing protein [Lachnospiraceae bacterium]
MIELIHLTKAFGGQTAVSDLNLQIETGEFFGLLGPNGAGKTTTIGMLSTVLLPTAGEIRIDGQLFGRKASKEKQKISVVTQEFSMRLDMTMDEIMEYQGRLMVCRALLTDPEILLLDEPTAGMDAIARRKMWEMLRLLNQQKLTIVLTTHYIEEAQQLCNRVAMMHEGVLKSLGTPRELIEGLGEYAVDGVAADEQEQMGKRKSLSGTKTKFFARRKDALAYLAECDANATFRQTTLEDVFVEAYGANLGGRI